MKQRFDRPLRVEKRKPLIERLSSSVIPLGVEQF